MGRDMRCKPIERALDKGIMSDGRWPRARYINTINEPMGPAFVETN
jgi:hypothetical protein